MSRYCFKLCEFLTQNLKLLLHFHKLLFLFLFNCWFLCLNTFSFFFFCLFFLGYCSLCLGRKLCFFFFWLQHGLLNWRAYDIFLCAIGLAILNTRLRLLNLWLNFGLAFILYYGCRYSLWIWLLLLNNWWLWLLDLFSLWLS